jgi:hypothetical protein
VDKNPLHAVWSSGFIPAKPYIHWLFFCAGFERERPLRRVNSPEAVFAGIPGTGTELATLTPPNPASIEDLRFSPFRGRCWAGVIN